MEPVTGEIKAPGGVTGSGSTFLINANGDNGLATLRYKLKNADIQAAEEPFDAGGTQFNARLVRHQGRRRSPTSTPRRRSSASRSTRVGERAECEDASRARGARRDHAHVAEHADGRLVASGVRLQRQSRTTYISTQDVAKDTEPEREVRRDPLWPRRRQRRRAIIDGMPMWRNPMPWKITPETPNIGTCAQTDDMRPGLGYDGRREPSEVREERRRVHRRRRRRRSSRSTTG